MADELWASSDPAVWVSVLDDYYTAVEGVGKEGLVDLERWYQEELPGTIEDVGGLKKADLVRLVEWKLKRGKWRPRLLEYANATSDEQVKDTSQRAMKILKEAQGKGAVTGEVLERALAPLIEIKGVGPATASAALSAMDESVPFMSDEALMAALGSKEYMVPAAVKLAEKLQAKARELTKNAKGKEWSARVVEQCIFAAAASSKAKEKSSSKAVPKKRKR